MNIIYPQRLILSLTRRFPIPNPFARPARALTGPPANRPQALRGNGARLWFLLLAAGCAGFLPVAFQMRAAEETPVTASLQIRKPADGARVEPSGVVIIEVVAVDPNGDIRHVEFFASDRSIGRSDHLTKDAVIPGRPREHFLEWTASVDGPCRIVAKAIDTLGGLVESKPVSILVGPTASLVSIVSTRPETSEPGPTVRVIPGLFTLRRTGATTDPLSVLVSYSGSATPAIDYEALPQTVTFPAGAAEVELLVQALEDSIEEGVETVVATLSEGPLDRVQDHVIDPASATAKVVIHNTPSMTRALLEITSPKDGQPFDPGQTITIEATAIDPNGYISRVEFFDFETRIGVSEILFIRAPDPGTPIYHSFEWQDPPAGEHVLTVRATDSNGTPVLSGPVRIVVGPGGGGELPLVQIVTMDAEAIEFSPFVDAFDPARFVISRTGDLSRELPVYFSLHGTAQPDIDYKSPGRSVVIPAGENAATVEIVPLSDEFAEGMETVALRIEDPLPMSSVPRAVPYAMEAYSREAAAVIYDRSAPETGALELALPGEGDVYTQRQPLPMIAAAFHPTLDVTHVDFYSDDDLVGSSDIAFFKPNGGGLIVHRFDWKEPVPGAHVITARARLANGAELISGKVNVSVPTSQEPVVVLDIVADDALAAEVGPDGLPDPAVFRVKRVGGPIDVGVTVWYVTEGTAQNGVDYAALEGKVTLPAGKDSVEIVINPLLDRCQEGDRCLEGEETVVIFLQLPHCIATFPRSPSCYDLASDGVAKAVILDHSTEPGIPPAATVNFSRIKLQKDGTIEVGLNMAGPTSRPCLLEASSDLVHWTEVAPVLLPDGTGIIRDDAAKTNPQRFYRTRLP